MTPEAMIFAVSILGVLAAGFTAGVFTGSELQKSDRNRINDELRRSRDAEYERARAEKFMHTCSHAYDD